MIGRWLVRRFWRCESGASALEFALIALPLVMLTFGIVEFARLLFVEQEIVYAADRAARVLYLNPNASQSEVSAAFDASFWIINPANLSISYADTTVGTQSGVTMKVSYTFHFLVPLISNASVDVTHERTIMVR